MSFPSGLYSHNQAAIEAGIEADLPQVDLPEGTYAIPQLDELQSWLDCRQWPLSAEDVVDSLRGVGVTAAWVLDGPEHEAVAVGVFDGEKYKRNYQRGVKYRCLAKAIDALVIETSTGARDDQDMSEMILADRHLQRSTGGVPASKKREAERLFRRRCIRDTFKVSWRELCAAARAAAPNLTHGANNDRAYWVPTPALLNLALRRSKVDQRKYVAERFDCDDFAICVKADLLKIGITAVGMVKDRSSAHAYLAIATVGEDEEIAVRFVEPQTDQAVDLGSGDFKAESGSVEW